MNVAVDLSVRESEKLLLELKVCFAAGESVALMGPSGSGKTTLLRCLAGRQSTGRLEGSVLYDGRLRPPRRRVVYLAQEDLMYEDLTPRENLCFSAALMLAMPRQQRLVAVEEVIDKLGLGECANTIIGSPGLTSGISGGERKRTSLALSLLGSPDLMLLDEPTSGLDSKKADLLIKDLKRAHEGCTMVAAIHQPSEATFHRFDRLLMLEQGRLAYYGPTQIRGSLQKLGIALPQGVPLPELLLEEEPLTKAAAGWLSKLHQLNSADLAPEPDAGGARDAKFAGLAGEGRPPGLRQLGALLQRELLHHRRNRCLLLARSAQTLASSLLIGLVFLQLNHDLSSLRPRLFSSFLLFFTQFFFALIGVVNTFPGERAVFQREVQDGLYHPCAFYLSKLIVDTLAQCFFPLLVMISYPLIGLNTSLGPAQVVRFYLTLALAANCGSAMGLMLSAWVRRVNLALAVAPGLVMPQLLLSGLFMPVDQLPQPFNAMSYVMVARYALQAIVRNEFSCAPTPPACDPKIWKYAGDCENSPCDFCCTKRQLEMSGSCPVLTCQDALKFLEMDESWPQGSTEASVWYNLLMLAALLAVFRLLGLLLLWGSQPRAQSSVSDAFGPSREVGFDWKDDSL
ncbi:unnamed protein product [Effrenium voratum]|nr:unnamed protein product [Effrenium voratum]